MFYLDQEKLLIKFLDPEVLFRIVDSG
jgi:hypothetical protein